MAEIGARNELARRLGLPEANPFGKDRPVDTVDLLNAVMDRVEKVERALDEINPGWTYGGHFHCSCASCES